MAVETFTFFEIILAGFVAVWTYRYFSKSQTKLSDFEYLGWSAFWGLAILVSFQLITKLFGTDIEDLLKNPFATGFLMSIIGLTAGTILGFVVRDIKTKIPHR